MGLSLYDKILNVLVTDGCDECCEECGKFGNAPTDCSECSVQVRYNPESMKFECPKGHVVMTAINTDIYMFKDLLKVISEYAENRKIQEVPVDELPLFVGHEFRFVSSRKIFRRRLKNATI